MVIISHAALLLRTELELIIYIKGYSEQVLFLYCLKIFGDQDCVLKLN